MTITGNIALIDEQRFIEGEIVVSNGRILEVNTISSTPAKGLPYILPGFIDAHVHIESSMLVPSEFARLAVVHGTVATVSDPHEIANVCGMAGVEFMIRNGLTTPFKFSFGAPSCVPATDFETAGALVGEKDIERLLNKPEVRYLSEMMNFPAVIFNEQAVMKKIELAHRHKKPVDGHAPGLRGKALKKYVAAGISTDHESFTRDEALEKILLGMKVLIREGSAAKNFDALIDLLHEYPNNIMFCSDDKHPDSLVHGHINDLCARAVARGIDIFHIIKAACVNPIKHYGLDVGLLHPGDAADFVVVKDLISFKVISTYISGSCVASDGRSHIVSVDVTPINKFDCGLIAAQALAAHPNYHLVSGKLPVIEALDGQLITNKLMLDPAIDKDLVVSDVARDILKIVVVNRYHDAPPAIAFIKNFGLQKGAIASSVAHDSHNVIAVGVDDDSLAAAINSVISARGGISCADHADVTLLPLPVGGLMSDDDGYTVAATYTAIHQRAKALGSTLSAPFMTLSFMALLVIPSLKLSDRGLFDGDSFSFLRPA